MRESAKYLRQALLSKLNLPDNFALLSEEQQLRLLINETDNVKPTAQFIVDAFNLRSKIIYLPGR